MIGFLMTAFVVFIILSPTILLAVFIRLAADFDDDIPKNVSRSYGVRPEDVVLIDSRNWTGRGEGG